MEKKIIQISIYADGKTVYNISHPLTATEAIGALEIIKHSILRQHCKDISKEDATEEIITLKPTDNE